MFDSIVYVVCLTGTLPRTTKAQKKERKELLTAPINRSTDSVQIGGNDSNNSITTEGLLEGSLRESDLDVTLPRTTNNSMSLAKSQQSVFLIYYWLLNFHNRIFFACIYVAIGLYDDTIMQYLRDDARLLPARRPPNTHQNPHAFF